ncbi:MAG: 6,7-dimethyl-8-ribityllumazine synthase [Bacteroidales bacterium]|nr:6,7-dimethyl-8-ribityllumazine synthase [Bacteroidales bacterium]
MKKTNLSEYDPTVVPDGSDFRIGVIAAEWNPEVTNALLQGAVDTLLQHGVKEENLLVRRVPGTFELSSAADMMLSAQDPDAVICIGCVIQGETRHFEFICQAVAQGITNAALAHTRPVIFSVLTTDTMQQALDRAGGKHGNKGVEGAITALKMIAYHRSICE